MPLSYYLPWSKVEAWEHGKVCEKSLSYGGIGLRLYARIIEHYRDGVAWFTYDADGKLVSRGTAESIYLAQWKIDRGAKEDTDAASRSA